MRTRWNQNRASFTLVELMVVIVILGILAGVITTAVMAALVAAREATIKFEVDSLSTALNSYRAEFGEFPPDFTDQDLVETHLRVRWPRITTAEVTAIRGLGLTRAQALVFWLRGFSASPTTPHTSTGPRTGQFDFDKSRLVDPSTNATPLANATTVPVYIAAQAGRAGHGELRPYLYFDARSYATSTYGYTNELAQARTMRPYRSSLPSETYAATDSFQIINAGLDANYGRNGTSDESATYPSGLNYQPADRDNIVSFNRVGRTMEDAIP